MSKNAMDASKKKLQASCFPDQDEARTLRRELTANLLKLYINDDETLRQLVDLDIGSDTLAALSLVPLVEVAWADGNVDADEREAILAAAESQGLKRNSASGKLLGQWLAAKPDPAMLSAWKEYVRALSARLKGEERRMALKQGLLGRARAVAEASGGFLGFGSKVSDSEQAVLDDLERAFQ